MVTKFLAKIFGTQHDREMKQLYPVVEKINALEPKMKALSDSELQGMTVKFRERLAKGETLDDLLPEAFAVCREGAVRVLGMRHYDVQLIGGMVLHRGAISEMKTGEGKTLVATLAIYLNALSGKGVHLVTVNNYLARRDAEWMGKLYKFLGMSVGVVHHGQTDTQKKDAYNADITYATNNELGFDYLRDNMKFELADYSQRELNFAIVDECDSILVDEARTPLIISGPAEESTDKYYLVNAIIPHLKRETHFTMEEKNKQVALTEEGNAKCEELLKIGNLYDPENIELMHHIYQGLKAHNLYQRDVDYVVKEGEIMIVDEFTGRLMEGRRWSDGLHQAVEAKENVKVKNENQTLATITFQNFFRMYKKLGGMTGTADTEAVEFKKIYNLDVVVIPTNRPIQRMDKDDLVYKNGDAKFRAIVRDVVERQKKGQPVLVGTVSIEKSELLSRYLKKENIPHNVLNAKQHEREAEIVAQAGRKGSVTIATNMAGRGTDIMLGGNPEFLAKNVVDDVTSEEYAKALAREKEACEKNKQDVIAAGGLYIVGTERHESRRIDNQLRGRSGRQGDPGETLFYLALDDDLMRKFNGERLQKFMTIFNFPEDEPITHSRVSKAIEDAQKRVEAHNFDIRKHLLDFDDVMNKQRTVIYGLRRQVLGGQNIESVTKEMMADVSSLMLDTYANEGQRKDQWNLDGLKLAMQQQFGVVDAISSTEHTESEQLAALTKDAILKAFEQQKQRLGNYFLQVQRMILLQAIDHHWKEHLQRIDQLRDWINLRAYAQKDPLVEYKQEAFKMFEEMNVLIRADAVEKIMKIQLVLQQPELQDQPGDGDGEESEIEPEEQLEALRPKQRQRLTYSTNNTGPAGGGDAGAPRSQRRKQERDKKKKLF